jgi:nitrate reductase / nitrite oxidoreductase, alpha subunit
MLRADDFDRSRSARPTTRLEDGRLDEKSGEIVVPLGSIGFRWGEKGKWNLEEREGRRRHPLALTLAERHDDIAEVDFPYFGGSRARLSRATKHGGADAQRAGQEA